MKKGLSALYLILLASAMLLVIATMQVSALEIIRPTAKTYNTTSIELFVSDPGMLDKIRYSLDHGQKIVACENCSNYTATLIVSEENHLLEVFGNKNSSQFYDNISFKVELHQAQEDFTLKLVSPEAKTYIQTLIPVSIKANTTLDRIRYKVDGGSYVTACTNCRVFNKTLDMPEGQHTVTFEGRLDDKTKTISVQFMIDLKRSYTLDIAEPKPQHYVSGLVPVSVRSNTSLDRLRIRVGGIDRSCYNCSEYNGTLDLVNGTYTLRATGYLENTVKESIIVFSVGNATLPHGDDNNETRQNETKPRFDNGFEKLPKLVEDGKISDSDLAEIIRENQLNPGIINRLIKTGKLGNESLDAILDYQKFKAVGIWDKFLVFFGYKGHTYAAQIAEIYRLPDKLEQKLIMRDDLPKGIAKRIQKDLSDHMESNEEGKKELKNNTKTLEIGKQLPKGPSKYENPKPGQDKKEDRIPPGQSKKEEKSQAGKDKQDNKGKGKGNN